MLLRHTVPDMPALHPDILYPEDIIAAIQNDVIPGKEYLDAMLAYREQYGVTA